MVDHRHFWVVRVAMAAAADHQSRAATAIPALAGQAPAMRHPMPQGLLMQPQSEADAAISYQSLFLTGLKTLSGIVTGSSTHFCGCSLPNHSKKNNNMVKSSASAIATVARLHRLLWRNLRPLDPILANAIALLTSRYIGHFAMNSGSSQKRKIADIRQSIILIGMMGVGKSTVGRMLAQKLGIDFIDSDDAIVEAAGMPITEIFERFGEDYFRDGERRVIARLIEGPPKVIATGGGAFINSETRALIKQKCTSIWIDAEIDMLVSRVSRKNNRPLLIGKDPRQVLTDLSEKRNPIYALADIHVYSDTNPHTNTVDQILEALASCTE
jgi:shikimate kinase